MNKLPLIGICIGFLSCGSQKMITKINQKLDSTSGKEIVLNKVLNDSRCPEDVQCIWAGEVIVEVSIYKDSKVIEKETLTFTPHNQKEMIDWFAKRLPKTEKPLQSIGVLPYPKNGVSVKLEDYFIKLQY